MATTITREQFEAYEAIRDSGVTNMWDTAYVARLSRGVLTKEDALEVIKQYTSLNEKYPEVRIGD